MMHSAPKPRFKCEECGMSFNSLEEFQVHNDEQHVAMP